MEELVIQLVESSIAQQAMYQGLMEALSAHLSMTTGPIVPHHIHSMFILKQTETVDFEAYLQTFERTVI